MSKYNISKIESAIASAVVVSDYLLLSGHTYVQAIGYGIMAGIVGFYGKHFVSNSLANEKALASQVSQPVN